MLLCLQAALVCAGKLVIDNDYTIFIPDSFEFRGELCLSNVFRVVREIHCHVPREIRLTEKPNQCWHICCGRIPSQYSPGFFF